MPLEDKIAFCTGADFWHTKELPQHGVPSVMMSDGPHGLRCQKGEADMIGVNNSLPATCFPAAVTAGATWIRVICRRRRGNRQGRASCRCCSDTRPGLQYQAQPAGRQEFRIFVGRPLSGWEDGGRFYPGTAEYRCCIQLETLCGKQPGI